MRGKWAHYRQILLKKPFYGAGIGFSRWIKKYKKKPCKLMSVCFFDYLAAVFVRFLKSKSINRRL
jgi:hypothetical protein